MEGENNSNGANLNENSAINRPSYSIPGILHFIQHEWARFEMERAQWEVERAELQARIAFLQGERKGQENLKRDLIRRIKMLEFSLRQERQKFHKLKYGTELKIPEFKDELDEEDNSPTEEVINKNHDLMFNYRQGRQLLRQYLQEIGYTDKVLDMRSARLHSLLGITTDDSNMPDSADVIASPARKQKTENRHVVVDAVEDKVVEGESNYSKRTPSPPLAGNKKNRHPNKHEGDNGIDDESSALDSFDFLQRESADEVIDTRISYDSRKDDEVIDLNDEAPRIRKSTQDSTSEGEKDNEVLKNFDFLQEESSTDAQDGEPQDDWNVDAGKLQQRIKQFKNETKERGRKMKRPNRQALQDMLVTFTGSEEEIPPPPSGPAPQVPGGDVALPSSGFASRSVKPHMINHSGIPQNETVEVALDLRDLAGLTVSNEASPLTLDSSGQDEIRKAWSPKYTLRSHFDCVRSLCFHPYESALITASEDNTLKLWSLQKNIQGKKGNISDLEPVYTFRGHSGPTLCVVINSNGSMCYSGGMDSSIQCWNLPSLNIDLFGPYDSSLNGECLVAHTDAVWDLAYHIDTDRLLSCSADGTVRLWNPNLPQKSPLLETYKYDADAGSPTSVSFVNTDSGQMVASYTNNEWVLFDMETAKPVTTLTSEKTNNSNCQINKVVTHPTLPMVITAHEDRYIRFFDINSGKEIHNMVAHLDAVTSLSVDPSGLYILSGSHDGSIRLWNMENKTCIQEITAHRKKFDEAVFDVAFHPTQPYIASAGADALAKVFA